MADLRPITEDEFESLHRVLSIAFGEEHKHTDESVEYERRTFEMALPGGASIPTAGVTWVGVLPTHRRQGTLRRLMDRQLNDIAERGEAVAVLTASEGGIYGRFGYGLASFAASVELAAKGTRLRPEPDAGGRFRLLTPEAAAKELPVIHDAVRLDRPGSIRRPATFWESWFTDPKDWRDGASERYYTVHLPNSGPRPDSGQPGAGQPDGYVAYRIKYPDTGDEDLAAGSTVLGVELRAATPEVEAALVRYLVDIDLVARVRLDRRPLDDPLRYRLDNAHRYRTRHVKDWLWVRLVDLPVALAARRYAVAGRLRLAVRDPFRPANDGIYEVEGGPAGTTCRRIDPGVEPDLWTDVDALAAAYLGGVSFTTLAGAGRAGGDPSALARADAFFAWTPLPFCDQPF